MTKRIYNFSAGPATLPLDVLEKAQAEFLNYDNQGMSLMEMSHRTPPYEAVHNDAIAIVKRLLNIPSDYEVLFIQGGASLQFSMVPMNLGIDGRCVDVINTGSWTKKAIKEIKRVSTVHTVATSEETNFNFIPSVSPADLHSDAAYVYTTSNNTIFGTQFHAFPDTGNVPLVSDMSSDILCRPLDISKFGLIFAGAQKNLGPSGVTLVIIRKDLAERCPETLPTMLQYRTYIDSNSMYNTPPTFSIYMVKLVLEWIESNGGLTAMEQRNREKASLLFDFIDDSPHFYSPTQKDSRSMMNVVFRIQGDNEAKEKELVAEAAKAGLSGIKGHRSVGGLRASIYNAMSKDGVQALVDFLNTFSKGL